MTVKEYNTIHFPKVKNALSFINCFEHAVQKSGFANEVIRQLAIIGWSEDCKGTILTALEEYNVHLREQAKRS